MKVLQHWSGLPCSNCYWALHITTAMMHLMPVMFVVGAASLHSPAQLGSHTASCIENLVQCF